MKIRFFSSILCAIMAVSAAHAGDALVNLTPTPKEMTVTSGSLNLGSAVEINSVNLTNAMKEEANNFGQVLGNTTGLAFICKAFANAMV